MENNKKLECEKGFWELLAEQDDMISKFLTWLRKKHNKEKIN